MKKEKKTIVSNEAIKGDNDPTLYLITDCAVMYSWDADLDKATRFKNDRKAVEVLNLFRLEDRTIDHIYE